MYLTIKVTVETTTDELLNITQEDVAELRQQEKWLDNDIFQPDNHEQACERWGILGPASPRLPGMVRSAVLKFWQPCAIWSIMGIMLSKQTRGGMIADSMGLGKTWEAIGVILARARQIELAINTGEDVQRKPTMVVVPPHLIEQWTDELGAVSGGLKFSVYYGDNRREAGSSVHIQGRLSSKHKIFGKNYDGTHTVILTAYNTFEARHGVSAVTQWHKDKYSRNYQPGDILPDDFPGNLKGCFGLVICDEAQYVRNEGFGISLSVLWLQPDFNLLMTGTPFFNNRNRDMLGYLKLWTMASSLPIGSNRTIGKDIPPAKKKILYCPMTEKENEAYNTY